MHVASSFIRTQSQCNVQMVLHQIKT